MNSTIVSNGLCQDVRCSFGPDLGPNVCKGYQQSLWSREECSFILMIIIFISYTNMSFSDCPGAFFLLLPWIHGSNKKQCGFWSVDFFMNKTMIIMTIRPLFRIWNSYCLRPLSDYMFQLFNRLIWLKIYRLFCLNYMHNFITASDSLIW